MKELLTAKSLNPQALTDGIDIVICTYNRMTYLRKCVESILPQVHPPHTRLTIIDNHSSDGTAAWVKTLMSDHPEVHYVFVAEQGLSHCRNKAAEITPCRHILFIDDDCIVPPEFVETAFSLLHTSFGWDAIGGPYYALYEGQAPVKNPGDEFSFTLPYETASLIEQGYVRGACMLVRTEIIRRLNGFDPALGMKGQKTRYGEEIEFQQRMRQHGYHIAYAPDLYVFHSVRPEQEALRWKLYAAYARRRDKRLFDPLPLPGALLLVLRTLAGRILWTPVHLLKWIIQPGYTWRRCMLDIFQPIMFSWGEWVGSLKSSKRS